MVDQAKRPRRKKSRVEVRTEATRVALLEAARKVFSEKGMDMATIDDITRQADVGKGTFYYHFSDKSELVGELMNGMLLELRATIDQKCQGIEDLELLFDSLIGAHLDFFSRRWEDFVLYFQGKSDLTLQEGYEGIDASFNEYLEHIASLLTRVIKYQLAKSSLIRVSCAVAGFVSGYYSFAVIASAEEELEEILKPVRLALVKGLSRFITEAIPEAARPVK